MANVNKGLLVEIDSTELVWSSPTTNDGRYPFVFVMFAIDSLRFQSAVSRGCSIRLIKKLKNLN